MNVDFEITEKGLVFTADAATREEIRELYTKFQDPHETRYNWYSLAGDVFEYATCNGLSWIDAADIGAMTDSPIFSDSSLQDDGTYPADAEFYWYPNYMVSDPIDILINTGRVVFTKGE